MMGQIVLAIRRVLTAAAFLVDGTSQDDEYWQRAFEDALYPTKEDEPKRSAGHWLAAER